MVDSNSLDRFARPNRVEVDCAAIAHNVRSIRRFVGADTRIYAALKGNGYGFGLMRAAREAAAAGADGMSVADLADGIRLRQGGLGLPILVYGGPLFTAEVVAAAADHDLTLTVHDAWSVDAVARHARSPLGVFVKVNVGLERFGLEPATAGQAVAALHNHAFVHVEGVATHMHVPGMDGLAAYLDWQFDRFQTAVQSLTDAGFTVPLRLASSSQVMAVTGAMNLNAVDPGHMTFGIPSGTPVTTGIDLRPALRGFKTAIVHVHEVTRTDYRDAGPFPVPEVTRVGVIPIGFSDGFTGLHCGSVLVRGRRVRLLSRHSSEHTRVDLTDVPEAVPGDEAVIIGYQGGAEITLEDVQRHQGHPRIADVVMAIPASIPRVYVEDEADSARRVA